MHLTDEELRLLIPRVTGPRREALKEELRSWVRTALWRKMPSPTGVCAHGHKIVLDNKGPMATGYAAHVPGYSVCTHTPWTWDEDSPERARIKRLIASL